MSFSVPDFPLLCNIYTGPGSWLSNPPRLADVPCNLAIGKRTQQSGIDRGSSGGIGVPPTLLLPGGTDVRDVASATRWDLVEVPAGSHRWYQVSTVEPVGLGFPNWHIAAALVKASLEIDGGFYPGLIWPTPDPYLMHNYP
jgi:hypothetical protein